MTSEQELHRRYPSLFAPAMWDPLHVQFILDEGVPSGAPIANVNTVPFLGDHVLVVRLDNGRVEMPGGTLEPGEHYEQAIARELMEEAGAELRSFSPVGYWRCFSTAPSPYRPHVPHPTFARLVGISDVLIVGPPSNPEGGERVVSVDALSVQEAAEHFIASGRPDLAELYRLASAIRRMHATETL